MGDMNVYWKYTLGGIVLIGAVAASYLAGDGHALSLMAITRATPDQIATAMESDNFYGLYRERTLIVAGVVASVQTQGNDTIVEFQTKNSIYKARCSFDTPPAVQAGDALTVAAEGYTAERQPDGVLLTGCAIP